MVYYVTLTILACPQIIGLLDVFTPVATYSDFQDVYLVTQLMGSDLNNILKTQNLTDEHVQFLVYQILRGLKVSCSYITTAHIVGVFALVCTLSWDNSSGGCIKRIITLGINEIFSGFEA